MFDLLASNFMLSFSLILYCFVPQHLHYYHISFFIPFPPIKNPSQATINFFLKVKRKKKMPMESY